MSLSGNGNLEQRQPGGLMQEGNRTHPFDERERLAALERYSIVDSGTEPQFDDLARLAASICKTPMALISLVAGERQWFKARVGLALHEAPRNVGFCDRVIAHRQLFVISDATRDPRFSEDPLVRNSPHIRFYAGMPLITADGFALGTLAVMDRVERALEPLQEQALRVLAQQVVAQFELRRNLEQMQVALADRDQAQQALKRLNAELERRIEQRVADLHKANARLQETAESAAREAQVSQLIIDSLPGVVYIIDEQHRFVRWNRGLEEVSGMSGGEIRQAAPEDFFGNEKDRAEAIRCVHDALQGESSFMEAELVARNGDRIPHFFTGSRIELDGRPHVCGMGLDIRKRRQVEEALRLRDRAVQASVNAIIITDSEGRIEYVNPAFERMSGYRAEEILGSTPRFLQGEDRDQPAVVAMRQAVANKTECMVLLRNYRRSGELFWNDVHIAPVRDAMGTVTHFVGVLTDVTAIKHYERELERHANVDTLTSLASRKALHRRMETAIATAQRLGGTVAVGFVDLDNFKFINDSLGHNIGDELLKRVAERLLNCLHGEDTLARYGGDEFVFVLLGYEDEKSVASLLEQVLRTVDRPFLVSGHQLFVSCSIGLSFYPRDGTDVDTLLKNADVAMHRAKERGRNNYQFYTEALNKRVTERLALESKLRRALDQDEFDLHYQPKLDLRTGRVVGVEALLRWSCRDTRGQAISPAVFIPLAEETGLINAIGEWALRTACSQARALQDLGLPPVRVAVNLSARQFEPYTLVALVRETLTASGLDASFLELELTESMVMRNPDETIEVLRGLKQLGLRLAIDDFGTGYSSLSYLQRFPVDLLKIDQSFVRDIGADPNDALIARAVISLGHSLGMQVIAEGVSSEEQLAFLRENQCDEIQGFLLSRPLPFHELTRFLRAYPRA